MTAPLLAMEGITKAYPGVQALADVRLDLARGEVLALLGENGAGKSTLMKILGGAVRPDAGRILIDGVERALRTPPDAIRAGVAVIHQELTLVPALGAADNIFLGREIARGVHGFAVVDSAAQRRRAAALLARLGADFDPDRPCRTLSVAGQQLVEIAKALASGARILVMDEPSAALSTPEVAALHGVIRDLRRDGTGIVYVSHRLDEIAAVCDRVTVLRDGRNAGGAAVADVGRSDLIRLMVGRELTEEFPHRDTVPGTERLVVAGLSRGTAVRGVSFTARRGEVLAITGLVGSGR
ncbi:MAG: sugar ABC transporter ATP-binding protein, partial [Planctomycetes bacterium]|nr:sugar ABC transporter ATP-binding protein [Planctomycetota bacterium]